MNLIQCIYYLGFVLGYKYWRVNKFFAANPDCLPPYIEKARELAATENDPLWNKIADDFQKSFDAWKEKNGIQ